MNAVLLTDVTWTRIFSQLSFLSDKHLKSIFNVLLLGQAT